MNILIVYDSSYGNTEKIAGVLSGTVPREHNVQIHHVEGIRPSNLQGIDLLIVGSPTQGGRPTQSIQNFITSLPRSALADMQVAAFDTRFAMNQHGRALKFLMRTIGFAAGKIAHSLQTKGGTLIEPPQGFIVDDKTGPLSEHEIENAKQWMKHLVKEFAVHG